MNRKYYTHIALWGAAALAVSAAVYFLFRRNDSLLEYSGAILGGIFTLLGVLITIKFENDKMYFTEYRPLIKLSLSDYQYDNWKDKYKQSYYIYLKESEKCNWDAVQGIVPLQIMNIGNSDVVIEKIELFTDDETRSQVYKFGAVKDTTFTAYSQESVDIPVNIELQNGRFKVCITYHGVVGEAGSSKTKSVTKKYSVYVPFRDRFKEYHDWAANINISGRLN